MISKIFRCAGINSTPPPAAPGQGGQIGPPLFTSTPVWVGGGVRGPRDDSLLAEPESVKWHQSVF